MAPFLRPAIEAVGLPSRASLGVSVGIGLLLATIVEMVVAELIPKNAAIARPLITSFKVALPLRAINTAFKPLITFLNAAANRAVRLVGIEPRDELTSGHSLEELQILVRSSREGGGLDEQEFSLLSRSISFSEKSAADALTPRVAIAAIKMDATLAEASRVALESGHSRLPVEGKDLDDIVGIAHIKEIYGVPVRKRATTRVSQILTEPLVVPESRPLESLLADMRGQRHQIAIVVDEFGGTAGIITLEDILEELVGEIEDEYDADSDATEQPEKGISVLSGMLHADEVQEISGFAMPDGPYETLAGFLLYQFDRIPAPGDQTAYEGWEFKVVEMEGKRIARVLVVASGESGRREAESA